MQAQEVDPYVNEHGEDWRDHPCYYVSIVDGPRFNVVAGPFRSHQEALDMVKEANLVGCELDDRAWFYGWGTVKMQTGRIEGKLNPWLFPLALAANC